MVVCESSINNIMGGIENTGGVTLHNHRRKLKQRFDIIKKLGQGTYGKVQLGINKETGQEVAIKTIKKCKIETEADLIRIRREIQIMSSVQHPNIIHIYEVFENREKMVLVMEYAAGGELYDYLSERKVLTEDEARRIFRQIATACYYCHKHKICHRDLKLENILLDENGSAKIADFGLSNVFDERRLLSTFCGSPLYASPEIVKGTPYHGPEVDCWSLGVLLYTLVYGAMPFDGSNFKRLVKQISQGDYFEPKKPSSASPLIREMLTVVPEKRANIEKICAHWWVNATYTESCLDIAEELANQTPVRLDLLLSLAPPPPQVGSDQLVIAGESSSMAAQPTDTAATPARSQSVGSLMDLVPPAERRIRDLVSEESKQSPKRKLEVTVSTENANMSNSGAKRKERPVKASNNNKEISETSEVTASGDTTNMELPKQQDGQVCNNNVTEALVKDSNVEKPEVTESQDIDVSLQGAACTELIEESKMNDAVNKEKKKVIVKKKTRVDKITPVVNEDTTTNNEEDNKENQRNNNVTENADGDKKEDTKIPMKRKVTVKKKMPVSDKTTPTTAPQTTTVEDTKATMKQQEPEVTGTSIEEQPSDEAKETKTMTEDKSKTDDAPSKPVERRRSKIFETAEKFQSLLTNNDSKTSVLEKPKKIFIPGVNVGGFKKEFERKASLTTTTAVPPVISKKTVPSQISVTAKTDDIAPAAAAAAVTVDEQQSPSTTVTEQPTVQPDENEEKKQLVKNAVSIISNAITKEGTRKSKSRPCMAKKPPVPFGINGRSASGSIGMGPLPFSPALESPEEDSSVQSTTSDITLKSATLPRRKTTKAEIQLDYPPPKPATMEFKTEMAHRIEPAQPEVKSPRSQIIVNNRIRSTSLDPDNRSKESPKEVIIPISFEREDNGEKSEVCLPSPQAKPPMPKPFQTQRSLQAQRFGSLSRQSTHESDTETTVSENLEPIRKSPREYIIPIAVEGGGYVTPRATSLEPSETSGRRSLPKFNRTKRTMGDGDGSEEELSFASLHRHNSVGRDSDNEDSRREPFHMHRLRSSRPTRKSNLEHADSLSSGEEDDDDGFEILTAENLFSTLLSRVRSLTQRLNVEDNGRLGFPSTRLLGNFDHGSKLWNLHNSPLSSRFSPLDRAFHHREQVSPSAPSTVRSSSSTSTTGGAAPWRRSVSRDLATDIERVFSDAAVPPSATATLPRDKSKTKKKEVDLSDLDLSELKLSDEDALALSYLTPGLSRRIQNQLLSQLPTAARPNKLSHINEERKVRSKSKSRDLSTGGVTGITEPVINDRNEYTSESLHIPNTGVTDHLSEQDKTDHHLKYKPYRPCCRSTSLIEPHVNPYRHSYYRNYSTAADDYETPKYNHSHSMDSTLPVTTTGSVTTASSSSSRYTRPYISTLLRGGGGDTDTFVTKHTTDDDAIPSYATTTRRVSRFLRPDFYDNCLYSKERKKREMETQKVLKEIRNKRVNENRDKDMLNVNHSKRETVEIVDPISDKQQHNINTNTSMNTQPVCGDSRAVVKCESGPAVETKTGVVSEENEKKIKRDSRLSKLVRPKSYPAETTNEASNIKPSTILSKADGTLKSKLFKRSFSSDKSRDSPSKEHKQDSADTKKNSSNQLLNSIEKKIRSFYSAQPDENKTTKGETKSRIQSTIRSLREQSEPRGIEHCVTESGLIKRAVSVEDFSTFGSNKQHSKTLQPSRKSVTKILGLFKKYEDKDKSTSKSKDAKKSDGTSMKKSKASSTKSTDGGSNTKIKTKSSDTNGKSSKSSVSALKSVKNTDNINQYNSTTSQNNDDTSHGLKLLNSKNKPSSKLPVSGLRNSTEDTYKPDRKDLKLNLRNVLNDCKVMNDIPSDDTSSRGDEQSVLFSPGGDETTNDSWSVCSDMQRADMSPNSDNKLLCSEEEANESVSDRIRRKSFYCRFNEKKKPRKSTIVNNTHTHNPYDYKNYDLKYTDVPNTNSTKTKSLKNYGGGHDNNAYAYTAAPTTKDTRPYKRATSASDNLYTYYNPERYQRESSMGHTGTSTSSVDKKSSGLDHKSLIAKPRRTSLQCPMPSRIHSNRVNSMSPPVQDVHSYLDEQLAPENNSTELI